MKKLYLLLCVLGVILPYYHLINFLQNNQWSMNGFWNDIFFGPHSVSMIAMDLTVAASAFLIYLIYQYKTNKIKILKYVICLFFSRIFSCFSTLPLRHTR
jgi:hypothetical protein